MKDEIRDLTGMWGWGGGKLRRKQKTVGLLQSIPTTDWLFQELSSREWNKPVSFFLVCTLHAVCIHVLIGGLNIAETLNGRKSVTCLAQNTILKF
jgi:hypothetical protein